MQAIKEIVESRVKLYNDLLNAIQTAQRQLEQLVTERLRVEGELRLLQSMLKAPDTEEE